MTEITRLQLENGKQLRRCWLPPDEAPAPADFELSWLWWWLCSEAVLRQCTCKKFSRKMAVWFARDTRRETHQCTIYMGTTCLLVKASSERDLFENGVRLRMRVCLVSNLVRSDSGLMFPGEQSGFEMEVSTAVNHNSCINVRSRVLPEGSLIIFSMHRLRQPLKNT
jgi:hypothetical protein